MIGPLERLCLDMKMKELIALELSKRMNYKFASRVLGPFRGKKKKKKQPFEEEERLS
jgi:hypothetical protein